MEQMKYRLEKELFEIPYEKGSIIYAPLKQVAISGNKNLVNLLCCLDEGHDIDLDQNKEILKRLIELGIVANESEGEIQEKTASRDVTQPFLPTNLTLFLTSNCNLRCLYCYGEGGDRQINMPMEIGYDALDILFLNAAKTGAKSVNFGFHGGGEPTLRIKDMKKYVKRAYKLSQAGNIGVNFGITTNGVLSKETARWVSETFQSINVSLDGTEDIQNYQRPMPGGKPSYKRVAQTLQIFDSNKNSYHIRGTITKYSEEKIPEIVDDILSRFSPTGIQLEPMFISNRSIKQEIQSPKNTSFVKGFIEAEKIAAKKGVKFFFSGHRFPNICSTFCGVGWKNFAVTPEGNVTACFEVLYEEDPRSTTFFFGRHDVDKGYVFDQEKINYLREVSLREFLVCKDCFAKFHCSGDCLGKGLYLSDFDNYKGGGRCKIIRALTLAKIKDHVLNNGGMQSCRTKREIRVTD